MKYLTPIVLILLLAGCTAPNTPTPAANITTRPPFSVTVVVETNTPRVPPLPTPTAGCAGAPLSRMILGRPGRVTEDEGTLNLRQTPNRTGRILRVLQPLALFTVLSGPTCADDFAWYQVRYQTSEGWVAEGDARIYYIEPYEPGG
jgi:hypothetical protein